VPVHGGSLLTTTAFRHHSTLDHILYATLPTLHTDTVRPWTFSPTTTSWLSARSCCWGSTLLHQRGGLKGMASSRRHNGTQPAHGGCVFRGNIEMRPRP
jgi:hypothetical protein